MVTLLPIVGWRRNPLINIPQGVTSIGDYAFWYCYVLASIEFPASVTSIGEDAFAECYGLEEILVDSANKNYASADGVLFNKNMTELIMYPSAKADTSYIVPSTVTKIDNYAFSDCSSILSVTLPEGLTHIGDFAFASCFGYGCFSCVLRRKEAVYYIRTDSCAFRTL